MSNCSSNEESIRGHEQQDAEAASVQLLQQQELQPRSSAVSLESASEHAHPHADFQRHEIAPIKIEGTTENKANASLSQTSSGASIDSSTEQSSQHDQAPSASSSIPALNSDQINFKFASAIGRMLSITQNLSWRSRILTSLQCRDVAEAEERLQLLIQFVQQSYQTERTPQQQGQTSIPFPSLPPSLESLFADVLNQSEASVDVDLKPRNVKKMKQEPQERVKQEVKGKVEMSDEEEHAHHTVKQQYPPMKHESPYFTSQSLLHRPAAESGAVTEDAASQEAQLPAMKVEGSTTEGKEHDTVDSITSRGDTDMEDLNFPPKPKISIADLLAGRL